jgi:hypothetical protein
LFSFFIHFCHFFFHLGAPDILLHLHVLLTLESLLLCCCSQLSLLFELIFNGCSLLLLPLMLFELLLLLELLLPLGFHRLLLRLLLLLLI